MLLPFFKNSFYPLLAGIPILVIQLWLSVTMKNQAIPLTIGIFASVFAVYGHFAPDWVLWKWPLLYGDWSTIEFVGAGVGMGYVEGDKTLMVHIRYLLDGMTLGFSITVLIVYYLVFIGLAWISFTKRDVAGN